MSAEVTGYQLDPPILLGCVLLAAWIQFIKNQADNDNKSLEEEDKSK